MSKPMTDYLNNHLSPARQKRRRENPKDPVKAIVIMSRGEAIDAKERWSKNRILLLSEDHRTEVVSTLIQALERFGVKVPALWRDVVANPTKFSEMAKHLDGGLRDEHRLNPEDPTIPDVRPTGRQEHDLRELAG